MKSKIEKDFNLWHENRPVDIDIDTPWHNFFKENAEEFIGTQLDFLEIGCGRGGFAAWFSKVYNNKFRSFTASDFSSSAIDIAKKF